MRRIALLIAVLAVLTSCGSLQAVAEAPAVAPQDVQALRERGDALEVELRREESRPHWVSGTSPIRTANATELRQRVVDARRILDGNRVTDEDIRRVREVYEQAEKGLVTLVPTGRVTVESCADDNKIAQAYQFVCPRLVAAKKAEETDLKANPPRQCIQNDVSDCTNQCDRGHPGSCEALAFMYQAGDGVAVDQSKASPLFVKACDGGMVRSCGEGGYALLEGIGVTADDLRGVQMLIKACEGRDLYGCFQFARYKERLGKPVLLEQAARLYLFTCNNDLLDGCVNLGVMYAHGKGIPQDKKKAAEYFKLACDKGEQVGCNNLAILQGKKPPASPAQIEQLWRELVAVADDLASKKFVARYAAQQARGARGQRQVQLMQQHMAEFQREEYCPAKKAFVDAAGQAEFRKRTQAKCKDDPPVAGGLNGPENLTADCRAVFAGGCP